MEKGKCTFVTEQSFCRKEKKVKLTHRSILNYRNVCKKLDVLPLRKVFSQFGCSHLSFKNLTLSTTDILALCLVMKDEQQATSLDFTGNRINDQGVVHIIHVLPCLPGVYQVWNVTIKTLLLGHNEFSDWGGKVIGDALARNLTLEDLDLSWNHLRRYGAVGVARGLQVNSSLCNINLSWNGFGFEGCVAVGDMLSENCSITELDLSCNRIGPPALLELLRGVARNKTLHILKIGHNPITAGFSSLILSVVKRHKESALQNIDMQGVVVDKEFVTLLREIQKERFFIVNYEVSLPVKKLSTNEMREMIGLPSAYNVDPLKLLYLLKEKMRVADFFYKINKDNDDGLQKNELYSLFDEAGLPVTGSVVDKIMDFMDTNDDGTIDLKEFLLGDKRIKNISRKQIRDDQERRSKDTYNNKYSRTFQKAHIDPITNALKIDPSTSPMRQSRRKSSTDKTVPETLVTTSSNILHLPSDI
ncbi:hypothetical protein Btru_078124 [Bulinus truncatus]|nr:hypothetical protein Btru_078124 [Bulinus truncatus]